MPLSDLSPQARAAARESAAAARRRRAEVRKQLKSGQMTMAEFMDLARVEPALGRMRVHYLVASMPGYANVKATAYLNDVGIAPARRVVGLGKRQVEALLLSFGE